MYCPRCGTNNREGSKFCNHCGTLLTPSLDVTCPACGSVNPPENAFCNSCGARLVPAAGARPENKPSGPPIKGLSLPTKPSELANPESPAPLEDAFFEEGAEGKGDSGASGAPQEGGAKAKDEPFSGDVPDWLAQLRAVPPAEEETTAAPPVVSDDAPSWIRQLQSIQPEEAAPQPPGNPEESPAPPVESKQDASLPTWLDQQDESSWLQPEQTFQASPADEQVFPSEEQPATGLEAPVEERSTPWPVQSDIEQVPAAPETSIPFPAEQSTAQETDIAAESSGSNIPEWLQDLRPPGATSPVSGATGAPSSAKTELPDWLLAGTGEAQPNPDELPEWLRMAMPAEKPAEAPSLDSLSEPSAEPVYQAPEWTQPRAPIESQAPAELDTRQAEPLEAGNPLAGLRGVLPLAVAVAEPHRPADKSTPVTKPEKDDGARLFENILVEAPVETELPPPPPARIPISRPLIYLLLALAVILPFLLPSGLAGSLLRISKTPAADFYDLLQTIPPDSTVLVAFEYDPSVAGEMDLQANAIVRHLMARRIKIIALSTLETGPQMAQKLLTLAASAKNYRYGQDYINFGYLAGHEAGLANLASGGLPPNAKDYAQGRDIKQYPVAQNIKNAGDVALVIELAGSEDTLKSWMEQVQPRTRTRIVAGVSAAVEPRAHAYRDAGQLVGLLSGLVGAAQYEILSNQPGQALTSVNAQTMAQMVLILIVLVGNLVHWISRAGAQKSAGLAGGK